MEKEQRAEATAEEEGPELTLWAVGAQGSLWAGFRAEVLTILPWRTRTLCPMCGRVCSVPSSRPVALTLQSAGGWPGGLTQTQALKPTPTPDPAGRVGTQGPTTHNSYPPFQQSPRALGRMDPTALFTWFLGMNAWPSWPGTGSRPDL